MVIMIVIVTVTIIVVVVVVDVDDTKGNPFIITSLQNWRDRADPCRQSQRRGQGLLPN
jgi:hypothetical protein